MWFRFPTIVLKENRVALSKEELEMHLEKAKKCGKSPEVGIYSFTVFSNSKPVEESVVLDKIVYTGKLEKLVEIGEEKAREGKDGILIFDGESYYLFVKEPLERLEDLIQIGEKRAKVVKNPKHKIVFPGYLNLKTMKRSRVVRRWKGA